jgi:hypothetical protein
LGKTGFFSASTNRLAENLSVVWPLHDLLPKQEQRHPSTQYAVYFALAVIWGKPMM